VTPSLLQALHGMVWTWFYRTRRGGRLVRLRRVKSLGLRPLEFVMDRLLPEEMSEEGREALREALEEHRRGETLPLEEALKRLD